MGPVCAVLLPRQRTPAPWVAGHARASLQKSPTKMAPSEPKPEQQMYAGGAVVEATFSFMKTQALSTAVKLGVADALLKGPLSAAELAKAVGAKQGHLERVMRLLVLAGIFAEPTPGVYSNNADSELLVKGGPMDDLIVHFATESFWSFSKMDASLKPGSEDLAFKIVADGDNYWEWLAKNEEASIRFNCLMTTNTRLQEGALLSEFDWSPYASMTIADIGGGHGEIIHALLGKNPGMKGIVFDQPSVVAGSAMWAKDDPDLTSGRVQLVGGSFFQSVPAADAYFMKHILHDWNDADCNRILTTIAKAAAPGTKLVIVDAAAPDDKPWPMPLACMDLQMMVMVGGKERTVSEWRELLAAGGFKLDGVTDLSVRTNVITATRI